MRSQKIRLATQLLFLAFLSWVGFQHQRVGGGPQGVPPVDALCPFGGFESLYSYIATGTWLRRIAPSSFVLFIGVVLMTIVVGRVFCSWICPLGTLGELSAKGARKLGIASRELPNYIDRPARYLKYGILFLIIFLTWKLGTLVWRDYDPWVAWMHLSAGWGEIAGKPWAFVILFGTVIAASLWIERFWCRYLCPLGAILALGQKLSLIKVNRQPSSCVHCHQCHIACPVNLDPEPKEVEKSGECLACGRCTDRCPVEKTLFFRWRKKSFSSLAIGFMGLALFFGAYAFGRLSGTWLTFAPAPKEVSQANPADKVYGWMSISQISEAVGLSEEEVIAIASLPSDIPRDVSLKKIEGVDDEEVRGALSLYFEQKGIPLATTGETPSKNLPNPDEIKGSVTLQTISQTYNIPAEKILEEAGWPLDASRDKALKELAVLYNSEVSVIREAIKKLLRN
ncbi:4Fe-4S binding protein [Aminobacterium mobile]|jgi:NapH/MauN family ferredoxin-type protein